MNAKKKNIVSNVFTVFLALLLISTYVQAEDGLIAHYTFDEGAGTIAGDSSTNNLDGTVVGTAWAIGRINGALSFDGQDDRVELGNMDISGSALTIMAWVKITAFSGPSSDGRILSKANDVAEDGHYWMLSTIASNGTKLRFRLKTDGTTSTLIGGTVSTGEWIHVAAVYDGSWIRLYKNGSEVAASPQTGAISQDNSVSAWIGDQPPDAGLRPWNGHIDELRIYDKALTPAEIQFVMNNGNEFPAVALTTPLNNQQFATGSNIPLSATASDSDGTIESVEFFAGDNKIAETFTSPYTATWENAPEGTYQITAMATDDQGSFTVSSPSHRITVGSGVDPTDGWLHKSTETGDLDLPTATGNQQTASLVLDINLDGITDFVITDRSAAPAVVWYESSTEGTWTRHVVEPNQLRIEAGGTFSDIDGDGDLDILFGGDGGSNQIWWWENPYPDFSGPWNKRFVKNSGSNKHHDQIFGDFDGDGSAELASWNQGASELILFEIPQDPKNTEPWPYTAIAAASSSSEGMAAVDVDGDGVEDIVGAGRWYRYNGSSYSENLVDTSQTYGRSAGGQFVSGGHAELVFGPGDNSGDLKFYQYDGAGGWDATLLKAGVDHGHSLHPADFNGDGNLDIFCAEMRLNGGNSDAKSWIFYGDGNGNFTESVVSEGIGNHESRPADLDGDGDIDILGKPYNWDAPRLDIWLNNGTGPQPLSLTSWQRHLVDGAMPNNSVFIKAGDINGDQHLDLIAGAWWWQNPGNLDGIWSRHTIGPELNNMALIHDFDQDGDLDILGTTGSGSSTSHAFRWARNNGSGNFNVLDNLQTGGSGDFLQGCLLDDFGSGNQIALSWHNDGGGLQALTIPALPSSETWPFSTFTATTLSEDLSSGDIDQDGDIDLLLGTEWLENNAGSWTSHTLGQVSDLHSGAEPDRNDLADIDGDGRLDAVVALEKGTSVVWFKAPVNPTAPWERHIVGTVAGQGFSMDTADFDGDSDPDIVIGEHRGNSNNRVIIFENRNNGATWIEHIIDTDSVSTIDHHDGTQAVDLDNDGDLDLISVGWYNKKVWIYENKAIDGGSQHTAPVITVQPSDIEITQGEYGVFSVSAAGGGPLLYQWQKNGVDIPFATESSLKTSPLSLGDSDSVYRCLVSNSNGQVTTSNVMVTVNPAAGNDGWWNNDWAYRFALAVDASGYLRTDMPIEFPVNFSDRLAELGVTGPFDPNALRVVEVTNTGALVNSSVAYQFDQAVDYDPYNNASGTIVFIAHGTTGPTEMRHFQIYFDTTDASLPAATIPPYIVVTDAVQHKGFDSVQINTQNSTWFFHKAGAGFATLLDSQNQDWIGFVNDDSTSASGWYRGIPNAIYPEDMMHPGRTGCQSNIISQGPVRTVIESVCSTWKSTWNVYPLYAQMRMDAVNHDYWFQYEGTPGGTTEADDFIITSDSALSAATNDWTSDITGEEWAYLGDSTHNRTFFAAHHEQDSHPERFYRMEGGGGEGMIIFSFGRGSGTTRYLTTTPQHFSIGLLETKNYDLASTAIRGIFHDISINAGASETLASTQLQKAIRTLQIVSGIDPDPPVFAPESDTTGDGRIGIGEAIKLLRESSDGN